jgi:hypothetical protein
MKKNLMLLGAIAAGTLILTGCCCKPSHCCRPHKSRQNTRQCAPNTCPVTEETMTIEAVEVIPVGNNAPQAQNQNQAQTPAQTPAAK